MTTKEIQHKLFEMQDLVYKNFHCRLMPTIQSDKVIGVRVPKIRALAKSLAGENVEQFLAELPHKFYEENNLHAFLIANIKNFDEGILGLEKFLPYIDNWATCDSIRPKFFARNQQLVLPYIKKWLTSGHEFVVRFAIETLMTFFLEEKYFDLAVNLVAKVKSTKYYVEMMQAWFFATAMTKNQEAIFELLEKNQLSIFVHNKTIQKSIESFRIANQTKDYLKTLRK